MCGQFLNNIAYIHHPKLHQKKPSNFSSLARTASRFFANASVSSGPLRAGQEMGRKLKWEDFQYQGDRKNMFCWTGNIYEQKLSSELDTFEESCKGRGGSEVALAGNSVGTTVGATGAGLGFSGEAMVSESSLESDEDDSQASSSSARKS